MAIELRVGREWVRLAVEIRNADNDGWDLASRAVTTSRWNFGWVAGNQIDLANDETYPRSILSMTAQGDDDNLADFTGVTIDRLILIVRIGYLQSSNTGTCDFYLQMGTDETTRVLIGQTSIRRGVRAAVVYTPTNNSTIVNLLNGDLRLVARYASSSGGTRITVADPFLLAIHDDTPQYLPCLLYTSPSPRDRTRSRMPSSA